MRYTTDPRGTWLSATLPADPVSFSSSPIASFDSANRVSFDGTYYAVPVCYQHRLNYVFYCTNPGGTWSVHNLGFPSSPGYDVDTLTYANGYWVAGGICFSPAFQERPFIAYSTSLFGPWTIDTSVAGTGVPLTSLGVESRRVRSIAYADGKWVMLWSLSSVTGYGGKILVTTNNPPVGGWVSPSSGDSTSYNVTYGDVVKYLGDGYWFAGAFQTAGQYTNDPFGAWSPISNRLQKAFDYFVWAPAGGSSVYYAQHPTDPSSTATTTVDSSSAIVAYEYADGLLVVGAQSGAISYAEGLLGASAAVNFDAGAGVIPGAIRSATVNAGNVRASFTRSR